MSDSEENAAPTTSQMVTDIVDKKGHSTSVVWRYFVFLQSDTKQSAVHCKLCRRFVPSKTGNTTNLFHHLKQCHPSETKMLRNYSPKQVLVNVDHLQAPAQLPSRVSCRHFPKPCLTTKKRKDMETSQKQLHIALQKTCFPLALSKMRDLRILSMFLTPDTSYRAENISRRQRFPDCIRSVGRRQSGSCKMYNSSPLLRIYGPVAHQSLI